MKVTYLKTLISVSIFFISIFSVQLVSAKVEVKFNQPEKFRDILVTGSTKNKSIEIVHKELNRLFEELSEGYLSEQQTLLIDVTDIDLAGDIEYMVGPNHEDIRIIRYSDNYRLSFNYEVKNEKGEIKLKGEKEIKNFVSEGIVNRLGNTNSVSHYERELKKWFKQIFSE